MIRLLSLLAFATFATAAEPPKAALTQKEIDEGWIQLFDGESTFGWKVEGEAKTAAGSLVLSAKAKITFLIELPGGSVRGNYSNTPDGGIKFQAFGIGVVSGGPDDKGSGGFRSDSKEPQHGLIVIENASNETIKIDRVVYLPEAFKGSVKPIFNGKDLTGWKVHDELKKNLSKFDVTDNGELRVTNGPGDLQTTGKYADFLLQFQCKTNGDSLNSGIFFRCIEGQYQNGYECQIQNAMIDNDPTKPKDFGTGAIYRRTPARKIVAKDKEWFSVTLVAHGDQFATWVNGYPVMQWKDERPADDNPRKGLRKAAGHLSIQGHDPTTDILFRKLQIAEFK